MKVLKSKKVFITIIFFLIIFLIIYLVINYKSLKNGNTISIKNKESVEEYILNINEYEAEIEVTVCSNKNENTYSLKQISKNNYSYQETLDEDMQKIIVENKDGKVIIKNNSLQLEKIYESYEYVLENTLYLTSFVEEYRNSEEKEIIEENDYYIINLKLNDSKNKYIVFKTLYINKDTSKIEKLEIEDINKNRTIYILYKEITINNN